MFPSPIAISSAQRGRDRGEANLPHWSDLCMLSSLSRSFLVSRTFKSDRPSGLVPCSFAMWTREQLFLLFPLQIQD